MGIMEDAKEYAYEIDVNRLALLNIRVDKLNSELEKLLTTINANVEKKRSGVGSAVLGLLSNSFQTGINIFQQVALGSLGANFYWAISAYFCAGAADAVTAGVLHYNLQMLQKPLERAVSLTEQSATFMEAMETIQHLLTGKTGNKRT